MTVPEGRGTEDWTASVAVDVPPVGETEGGLSEPVAAAPAGRLTSETLVSGRPAAGTPGALAPASATTKAKSPTDGTGMVSEPFGAPRFGETMSHACVL